MFDYLKGKITKVYPTYIVLDNNNIGYRIFTPNPYLFAPDEEVFLFTYLHVREDELTLYGFKTREARDFFLKLIEVKRLGPKMALPILATSSVDGIIDAIERENILYLTKFPKIGDKLARQIILDLKGKLGYQGEALKEVEHTELIEVLKGLGYKTFDINKVLVKVNFNNTIEEQVKEALKLLLK